MRCKPAVPLAGKYRLVDIPISNCINSGFTQLYVLTQFNTASLHRHIQKSFQFDPFGGGFIEILSAEQTELNDNWYQGTADAVRQNMHHFRAKDSDLFVILSGDQLYHLDFQDMVQQHQNSGAAVTIAAKPIVQDKIGAFGALGVDEQLRVQQFEEKPQCPQRIASLSLGSAVKKRLLHSYPPGTCLASMGIYIFSASALRKALEAPGTDFGGQIIPALIEQAHVCAYLFEGYWEDIGTVRSFFDANLMLTDPIPAFNFFDAQHPIYTNARHLPASKINSCQAERTVLSDGCILTGAHLRRCVVGVRACVNQGSELENTIIMGADRYETLEQIADNLKNDIPPLGIGRFCHIRNAIIDKNVRIGDYVHLSPEGKPDGFEQDGIYVQDGIVCVSKNCIIRSGTVW
jgi:glucose-1-phosphate adenylyltransferase